MATGREKELGYFPVVTDSKIDHAMTNVPHVTAMGHRMSYQHSSMLYVYNAAVRYLRAEKE